ncbi:uncharacterized protein MEPE_06008 [Melanopsichium pennsylvanicum]|uniref:HD/PDEase domain-containing protein n=2 Tax=Melanopsichium pennsylvanicum TaxID=63383 RepID=A0AAJ5C875_9BASI|nr:hd domain containing protein [Melanopsichium pennsylvanicum 4]SNX87298.1 uncharacterized protein MEPE_06008 [Melanopsichium pennsylvanicum]
MDDLASTLATSSLHEAAVIHLKPSQRAKIISTAETFVKNAFVNHDPSHDWHHVNRVRLLSLALTRSPELASLPIDLLAVELGALFHDLTDAKYNPSSTTPSSVLSTFWSSITPPTLVTDTQKALVEKIVANVSWSKDVRRRATNPDHLSVSDVELAKWLDSCSEFWCVSDADRLDSIGSIGIFRCAAFSTNVNRPLYVPPNNPAMDPVPPAEQGEGYNGSAVAHFYEKLLKIKGERLYTEQARQEAERRQGVMQNFLQELDLEWLVASEGAQLALMDAEAVNADEDEEEREDCTPTEQPGDIRLEYTRSLQ